MFRLILWLFAMNSLSGYAQSDTCRTFYAREDGYCEVYRFKLGFGIEPTNYPVNKRTTPDSTYKVSQLYFTNPYSHIRPIPKDSMLNHYIWHRDNRKRFFSGRDGVKYHFDWGFDFSVRLGWYFLYMIPKHNYYYAQEYADELPKLVWEVDSSYVVEKEMFVGDTVTVFGSDWIIEEIQPTPYLYYVARKGYWDVCHDDKICKSRKKRYARANRKKQCWYYYYGYVKFRELCD